MDITEYVNEWNIVWQWILAVAILAATIGVPLPKLIYVGVREVWYMIKPKRENWLAFATHTPPTSDIYGSDETIADNAWKTNAGRWTSGDIQKRGDWYFLLLDKPRNISKVAFRSEGWNLPLKVNLQTRKSKNDDRWHSIDTKDITIENPDFDTRIEHEFSKNTKIFGIKLLIEEPRLEPLSPNKNQPPAWNIHDIDIWEYRLFGFVKRKI